MKAKEIAKLANVSVSTVSKVLTNQSDVADATREHVLKIMDESDFRPPRISTEHKTIAYITNDSTMIESSYGSQLLSGMYNVLSFGGYQLMLLPFQKQFSSRVYLKHFLRSYGIAGVICYLKEEDEAFFETLVNAEIPHIIFEYKESPIHANTLNVDNRGGGYQASRFLVKNGHHQMGLIYRSTHASDTERSRGFKEGLSESGSELTWSMLDDGSTQSEQEIEKFLRSDSRPTAVFSTNYISSLRLLKLAREAHCEIPKDLSLVSFGDYDFTSYLNPALTTLRIPAKQMGIKAAEELLLLLRGQRNESINIFIPTELIVRESVRALMTVK